MTNSWITHVLNKRLTGEIRQSNNNVRRIRMMFLSSPSGRFGPILAITSSEFLPSLSAGVKLEEVMDYRTYCWAIAKTYCWAIAISRRSKRGNNAPKSIFLPGKSHFTFLLTFRFRNSFTIGFCNSPAIVSQ